MIHLLFSILLSLNLASSVCGDVETNSTAVPDYKKERSTEVSLVIKHSKVFATYGSNVTLPCRLNRQSEMPFGSNGMRIKWSKMYSSYEEDVLVSMGFHKKSFGSFQGRVELLEADESDASIMITDVTPDDFGKYTCEVIHGMDDGIYEVYLEKQEETGVVFPYSPRLGRYNLNFHDAEKACLDQDSVVATFEQLYKAWRGGLDWCNAGWLNDSTVQYPINVPRGPCGGMNTGAGLRNYGRRDKSTSLFDVFCYTSKYNGQFYYLIQPDRLTYDEAVLACQNDGAEIAKVGQMYAAWKLLGYDRCDAGWLADGSVRYPISNPRRNCSPTEAAVRFVGFPDKKHKLYGAYCYRAQF